MQTKFRISTPSLFFGCFLCLTQFMNGITITRNEATSSANNIWLVFAFYWALGWWFINDARKEGIKWLDEYLDLGLFLYIGWIFLVPYHLFKTRGWKAPYTVGFFLGTSLIAFVMGAILSSLVNIFQ